MQKNCRFRILHKRIGKLGRCANYKRQKSGGIRVHKKLIGTFVVLIGRGEYREIINENLKLKRLIKRMAKFMEAYK